MLRPPVGAVVAPQAMPPLPAKDKRATPPSPIRPGGPGVWPAQ